MSMTATLVYSLAGLLLVGAGLLRYALVFPRQPFCGPLPPLDAATADMARRLETHVTAIASTPHNMDEPEALEAAAIYIETALREMGHAPQRQTFRVRRQDVCNIELVLEPEGPPPHAPTIVVGAHYDSAEEIPGANDNGTGVAALIEIARALGRTAPGRARLRLVFFVNEEQPYGKTSAMGSWRHAERLAKSGEPVAGMIALETIGYFSNEPGTQFYPPPFGLIYGNVGNFIGFVGMPRSRAFLHSALASFRATTPFPSIGGVAPGFLEGIDLSDHWAYDKFGFPAFMVTDTAPFRNPYYHEPDDLPQNVDYEGLARVTTGLVAMLRHMSRA